MLERRAEPMIRAPASASVAWIAIAATIAALLLGYTLKACPGVLRGSDAQFACHTDITTLYRARGIDRGVFPYVHGSLAGDEEDGRLTGYDLRLLDGANEYPVLTGLFMWSLGPVANDESGYLAVTAVALAAFALLTTATLARMSRRRALLWAVSPALVLYAFHNWDLLAVGIATFGVYAWWNGRRGLAAAAFAVGAAFKFYPALLLIPLLFEAWTERRRAEVARLAGIATAVLVAVNAPIALASPQGWSITYRFHSLRPANYDSLWGVGSQQYELDPQVVNVVSTALFVATAIAVLLVARRRAAEEDAYPFVACGAAIVSAYLLWGKVHSPQYALWLVPFFVLLDVRVRWWVAYMVDTAILYIGIFVLGTVVGVRALTTVVQVSVYARAAILVCLVGVFSRARPAFPRRDPDGRRPATPSTEVVAP